jgi:hypothetical protein
MQSRCFAREIYKTRDRRMLSGGLPLVIAMVIAVAAVGMMPLVPAVCSAGAFTPPQQVTDVPGGANLDEIAQAVDQNGFTHIVWTGGDEYYQVWYADNTRGAWSVTQLTSERDHYSPGIVVDSNGKTHLTWYGDDSSGIYQIYYATNASGEWVTNQVTSSQVNYQGSPTLAIDGYDNLHLAWEGPADLVAGGPIQVWYTQDLSGAHNEKATDSAEDVWSYDLTLDSAGHGHIAWCNSSSHQIFATDNTSGSWVTGQVTSTSGNYWPRIAIDSQGFSHLAWFTNVYGVWISNVWYTDNVGGSWGTPVQLTFSSSFEDRYQSDQIALDGNDVCYIAVNENRPTIYGSPAWLFSNASGSWTSTLVTDNGNITSMELGPDGNPQMVWAQGSGGGEEQVWYGRKTAEGLTTTQITSSPFRQYMPTLGVDSFGEPFVVWNGHVAEYVDQVWFTTMPSNPVVTGVSPGTGVNDQSAVRVTVQGDVLKGGATLTLTGPDTIGPVPTTGSGSALNATLDLNGKAAGSYRATVTNHDGFTGSLDNAFTVTEAPPPPSPPTAPTTWYLAEGTNAWGFSTYITIENPVDSVCHARLSYMDPNAPAAGKGILKTRTIALPALSQTTVSSMSDIGEVDFATKVECVEGSRIAVDRTMFWSPVDPAIRGYHSSIGTDTLSKTWYLPEGSSNWGFETWTAVLNPNNTTANITLTYMTEGAGPKTLAKTIPPNSRATWNNNRREGSCSIGAPAPASDFILSEGAVGYAAGFTTWVLVQNPANTENTVTLTYQTGSGAVAGPTFTMGPNSRKTVKVNDSLPPNTDVSTVVHGSKPIVAERAMYWDAGLGECFHASIGLSEPHMTFMCPDGQAGGGAQTWTLVSNPNPGAVTVRITYLPQNGGKTVSFTAEIPSDSRATFNMADKLKSGRAAILVESLDGARPVMVERAMYGQDWGSGTDTIGAFSD